MLEDLGDEGMAEGVNTIARHIFTKKGNLKQCQNYRSISLISHPSKIMLRVIRDRLKAKAEKLLLQKQARFRPGRSTEEHIFNSRVIIGKYQRDLFRNFIDFKKPFDRVWHAPVADPQKLQHR